MTQNASALILIPFLNKNRAPRFLLALLLAALTLCGEGVNPALAAGVQASSGQTGAPPAQNAPAAEPAAANPSAEPATEPAAGGAPNPAREVVVTATRVEREAFDVPSSIAIVNQRQLQREPHGTIAEQLQDIPGVEVADGGMGGGTKRVHIRGESAERVLILIDGMKISEQKSMEGSMIMIDPLNVERIEVIKGPASVLYGSEAIGGVVNIITKKGGTRPIQATLAMTLDSSNDSATPYASVYGSYNGFNYRVSGDYVETHNKRSGSGSIANTSYMQRNISAYLDYTWEHGKIGAGYDQYWSSINIPGADSGGAHVELDLPRWQRDRYYAFLELNQLSDYLQKIKLTGFMQKTRKDFANDITATEREPPSTPGPFDYIQSDVLMSPFTVNKQATYGANLQTDWTFGDHYVIAGIDYLYDDLDATSETKGLVTVRGHMAATGAYVPMMSQPIHTYYNYDAYQQSMALFAQDEWSFHPDWTLTFGLRWTWLESSLTDTDDNRAEEGKDRDSHLVGSLGLVYSGFENWRLRANFAQGYRYPLLNQMYIGTSHGQTGYTYPNPNLKPETSQNFEVGARYSDGGFAADLAVFYSLADDYITTRSLPGPTADMEFTNVDKARTWGTELTLSYTIAAWNLTPYLSGAYMHRTFDYGGESTIGKTSKTGLPPWTSRVGLKYEIEVSPTLSFYADAFGRFAAGAKEKISATEVEKHPGWGTANLALGMRFGEERKFFMDVNVNNIFDRTYTTAANTLEEPGAHVTARIGFEF
ncbi:MAG: TonB-dependent receptor [Desulfovibrio sp.]|jgi:hemoglobin/transferrin/lactoferrin receptor protein|nr:TonB-dependent receptor [Desulfovibrio sp.]